jgi:K+ potassium transporter/Patatin-like phospholipase
MSIDNDGEGGILALMSLLGMKEHRRPLIVIAGLLGAALIYGDGAITPAISVLSALEGLQIAAPTLGAYSVPAAVAILVLLFGVQPLGTSRIGAAFGPIMLLWFVSIGALGLWGVAHFSMNEVSADFNVEAATPLENKAPWRPDRCDRVALVQGGGALGAYQAGVYQAMHEARLEPDWVSGVSIGAINSAIIAGNPPSRQ